MRQTSSSHFVTDLSDRTLWKEVLKESFEESLEIVFGGRSGSVGDAAI